MIRTAHRAGFTLMELILVMLLMTILAGLAIPQFAGMWPGARIRTAAADLHGLIVKVRADSAVTMRRYRLYFDQAQNRMWVKIETDAMKRPGEFAAPSSDLEGFFTLPDGVAFQTITGVPTVDDGNALTFNPDGTVEAATIVMAIEEGPKRTVTIEATTGKVTVAE